MNPHQVDKLFIFLYFKNYSFLKDYLQEIPLLLGRID